MTETQRTRTEPVAARGGPLVVAEDLVKRFGHRTAVDGVDVEVRRGETFGFLGPNGAGKTSTMRMIACVSPPTSGHLRVLGMDPAADGPAIRARLGVVPQADTLDEEMSAFDNLIVYGRFFGLRLDVLRRRTEELLAFVQLEGRARSTVEELSGGMRRRLVIARALVNEPELVLLDEPTTGLDPQARHLVWERLRALKRRGVSFVLTTHYMDEAEQLCDRLVVMDGGRIVAEGSPRELVATHASREVVEVHFAPPGPGEHAAALDAVVANGAARHRENVGDRVLFSTDDATTTQQALREAGVDADVLVRRGSLEDVFLRLTGRALVE